MLRFIGTCLCIVLGFMAASRLQVHEGARFVTRTGEVIAGTVSREFISGDYVIQTGQMERHIARDQLGAMAMGEAALSFGPIAAVCAGLFMAILVGFGGLPQNGGAIDTQRRANNPSPDGSKWLAMSANQGQDPIHTPFACKRSPGQEKGPEPSDAGSWFKVPLIIIGSCLLGSHFGLAVGLGVFLLAIAVS